MTCKTPIPLLVPRYTSGLRTPVQHQFSLELARCSNSVSHSNKFYSPLILPQVWKFFFIPLTHKDSVQLLGCMRMFFFFSVNNMHIQCDLGKAAENSGMNTFSSVAQSCPTLCNPMDCSTPGYPVHQKLSELTQTHQHESVMPSNHLILCHSLLLTASNFLSIRVFFSESVLGIRWPSS